MKKVYLNVTHKILIFYLIILSSSILFFFNNGLTQENDSRKTGIVTGRVTRGPVCPAEREDICKPVPVEGVKVVISDLSGNLFKTLLTDKDGIYKEKIPFGTYNVRFFSELLLRKDIQRIIKISAGEETRLDFQIDTGVR